MNEQPGESVQELLRIRAEIAAALAEVDEVIARTGVVPRG